MHRCTGRQLNTSYFTYLLQSSSSAATTASLSIKLVISIVLAVHKPAVRPIAANTPMSAKIILLRLLTGMAALLLRSLTFKFFALLARHSIRRSIPFFRRELVNYFFNIIIISDRFVTPLCGGRIISVRLLRSPASSDCAFNRVGCSVSSRYTFPFGLGSAFSAGAVYHIVPKLATCSLRTIP